MTPKPPANEATAGGLLLRYTQQMLADHHKVSLRSLVRWLKDGCLPPANVYVAGRSYWAGDVLDEARGGPYLPETYQPRLTPKGARAKATAEMRKAKAKKAKKAKGKKGGGK